MYFQKTLILYSPQRQLFFYWNPRSLYCVLLGHNLVICLDTKVIFDSGSGNAPKYLSDFLVLHQPNRHLCSNNTDNLQLYRPVFRTKKTWWSRFSILCTRALDGFVLDARGNLSIYIFKNRL